MDLLNTHFECVILTLFFFCAPLNVLSFFSPPSVVVYNRNRCPKLLRVGFFKKKIVIHMLVWFRSIFVYLLCLVVLIVDPVVRHTSVKDSKIALFSCKI